MNVENRANKFRIAYPKALAGNWKGGILSISAHLKKRKERGHLPGKATEKHLIQKGMEVLNSPDAKVYEDIPLRKTVFCCA